KNPIYYFYKSVEHCDDGSIGALGDKHFKCYHGNGKISTLKKSGKSNLTSMVTNLKSCSPNMYQLFTVLKGCPADHAITQEEIELASGKKVLDAGKAKEYFHNLELSQENIQAAFNRQATNTA
ncbi:hypothetical protein BYT27DRAFT_7020224, partial [Phlegmacium glaucopus]